MSISSGKEFTKTLLFVGAAVLTMFVAINTRPKVEDETQFSGNEVGVSLFPELTDTSAVTGLEVLSFNEELGSLRPFEIEQEREGEWVIPSRQRYPADAQDRVARAATMFVDLKVLRVRSDHDADHEKFGVVEPKFGATKIGDEGVGTLFKVNGNASGKSNSVLAELIIGKPVKDLVGQHFVRRPGKSRVYQVEIDPSQLSTEFIDWIDTRLLPFSEAEVSSLGFRNYTTGIENGNALSLSMNYEAKLVNSQGEWKLQQFVEPRGGSMVESKLSPGEIINQVRLGELSAALSQVVISNVQRKPDALAAKLRDGSIEIASNESSASLASRGFFPARTEDGRGKIYAAQGELQINTTVGVQFRLLLGDFAEQSNDGISADTSLNRFLIIIPQIHEQAFPEPELEELPADDEEMSENDRKIAVERITKSNQRKTDEYEQRKAVAEQLVTGLRPKFADWYYLVSEDVLRKLRVPKSELITLSQEALTQGFGIEAFRKLQQDGLKKQ